MQTLPEAQMPSRAMDVEAVRIGKVRLVAVGRGVEQEHVRALGHGLPVKLGVLGDVATLYR